MIKTDDPYKLANALTSSYDNRVHVCRGYIIYEQEEKLRYQESLIRDRNPALRDAWEQYQTLLKLIGNN